MSYEVALAYTARWPVFPCIPDGPRRKQPLTAHGFRDASREEAQIREWWRRYPNALIGVPTGRPIGADVLDVDVKYNDRNGFDTLAALGHGVLPDTPMAHTASGGLHLYSDYQNMSKSAAPRARRAAVSDAVWIGAAQAASSSCHLPAAATTGILTGI